MNFLVLDFDGVMNDHTRLANGYCQLKESCVLELCRILDACPEVKVVISSAWRYMMIEDGIGVKGFEYLLCLFGAPYDSVNGRIYHKTPTDEWMCEFLGLSEKGATLDHEWLKENGCLLRREQIEFFLDIQGAKYVVLDDLDLEMPELVRTDGEVGLTEELADEVIRRFNDLR
jgi:hypothetical protein